MAKSITITANDDGSFTVEAEPAEMGPEAPEGPENGAADMAEDQAEGESSQQAASIDEALEMAKMMLGGGEEAPPLMEGEDQFTQGFKQVRGSPDEQAAARMG